MANRKITDLTALVDPATDDVLPIVDVSEGLNANKNKKITYVELFKSIDNGTATAPAIAFNASANTGIYRSAANELSIATAGGQAIKVESNNKTTIYGDLVVTGSQTTISSTTIDVADKNIQLATGNSSDAGADGGGLTLKGATDKTWNWVDSTDAWTANQHIDITTGKVFKIAGTQVLNATTLGSGIVNSSLTSVGTLGSLTVTNAVTAGSLDISGGADIDGTLEADAYTVNGTALNEYIADTVGAMVSSNTETNITVTYDDSDNTLDFVIGTLNQNTTGNAATATALETARTIGGVSFNGTANINLPGVNQTGNQNTTGSAATLTTARTIGGVSFDGSANINLPGVNAAGNQNTSGTAAGLSGTPTITVNDVIAASLDISGNADIDGTLEADAYTVNGTALNEYIADTVGAMVSSNTETNITVTYDDADNTLDFVIGTLNQNTTGNAATATALQTARTIGGVSFDGTANITLPGVNATGNQNTTGSAATLTTARTIGGVSFNGSANIDLPGVNTAGNQNTSGTAANLSGTPNITVGDVVAASLDISGNVDVDGTLETDGLTINGTSLSETIADTVGAMVSSNTETGITVTYDDADNTLDFVVGTLNQNTTGNAATATALQNARTINGVSFDGTGNITVTAAAGTLTGSTLASGITASSLTSVGTLTGLTTSGNILMTGTGCIDVAAGTTAQRPGSPNAGMFRYNTTLSKFEGHDGSAWGEIGGGGGGASFYINTLSSSSGTGGGSATFNGTAYRFQISNAPATGNAAQMLVSVGGVIQKANSGTSQPSEGYAIDGNDIIFGAAPASAASWFIITYGALNAGEPTDNTVNEAKLQVSNSPTNGYFLSAQSGNTGGLTWAAVDLSSKLSLTGGTLTGQVNFDNGSNAGRDIQWQPASDRLAFFDNTKATFGDGVDLQIYHDGSDSFIKDGGTGSLKIGSSAIWLQAADYSETMASFTPNGAVELYHNNFKSFKTAADGIFVYGPEGGDGILKLYADEGDDNADKWRFVSGTDGSFYLQNFAGGTWEKSLKASGNGNVELYYNHSKKFETTTTGTEVISTTDALLKVNNTGDGTATLMLHNTGSTDFQLALTNAVLTIGTTTEASIKATANGAVELYYDGTKKFETRSDGILVSGNIQLNDSNRLDLGNNGDLRLYHDGSNSYITNSTGIFLQRADDIRLQNSAGSEVMLDATANGAVNLYYDNSKKFHTTNYGAVITGKLFFADGSSAIDIGDASDLKLWHNGTNSHLENSTNTFYIRSDLFSFQSKTSSEQFISCAKDGAVELYFNNTKRFDTNNGGAACHGAFTVHGELGIDNGADNHKYMDVRLGSSVFWIRGTSGGDANHENMIGMQRNGRVELHYDAVKKLETYSGGINVTGYVNLTDSQHLQLGTGNDLQLYHDGTKNIIRSINGNIEINNNAEYMARFLTNGAVELYHDNSKKFHTTSSGATITGTLLAATSNTAGYKQANSTYGSQIWIGGWDGGTNSSGISRIRSSNDNLHIDSGSGGNIYLNSYSGGTIRLGSPIYEHTDDARIQLRNTSYNSYLYIGGWSTTNSANISRIRTSNDNLHIDSGANGNIYLNNYSGTATYTASVAPKSNNAFTLGSNGNWYSQVWGTDLYSNSWFRNQNSNVGLYNTATTQHFYSDDDDSWNVAGGSSANCIRFRDEHNGTIRGYVYANNSNYVGFLDHAGNWAFYYNDTRMVSVHDLIPSVNNDKNLGIASNRWANLYVNDAHFSNEGSSNSVDGTWGDWTLQEGEEDVFMINNRSGKKYRMALQEVS